MKGQGRESAPVRDEKYEERTVRGLREEFARRQEERRLTERGWELNMNFLTGNQYCGINPVSYTHLFPRGGLSDRRTA